MSLTNVDIDWFARQIVVPGIGSRGQQRLLEASITACGDPVGVEAVNAYASAAGIRVQDFDDENQTTCIVAAGIDDIDEHCARTIAERQIPLVWYSIRGKTLQGGVLKAKSPLPERSTSPAPPGEPSATPAEHRLAGYDAAGSAVCLILDWPTPDSFEVRLD